MTGTGIAIVTIIVMVIGSGVNRLTAPASSPASGNWSESARAVGTRIRPRESIPMAVTTEVVTTGAVTQAATGRGDSVMGWTAGRKMRAMAALSTRTTRITSEAETRRIVMDSAEATSRDIARMRAIAVGNA